MKALGDRRSVVNHARRQESPEGRRDDDDEAATARWWMTMIRRAAPGSKGSRHTVRAIGDTRHRDSRDCQARRVEEGTRCGKVGEKQDTSEIWHWMYSSSRCRSMRNDSRRGRKGGVGCVFRTDMRGREGEG